GRDGALLLLPQLGREGKGRLAAPVVGSEAAPPRRVPDGGLVEEFGERVHVGRVEGLVGAPHDRRVLICSHRFPPARWSQSARDITTGPRTPPSAVSAAAGDVSLCPGHAWPPNASRDSSWDGLDD